jgi:hypothetical protein
LIDSIVGIFSISAIEVTVFSAKSASLSGASSIEAPRRLFDPVAVRITFVPSITEKVELMVISGACILTTTLLLIVLVPDSVMLLLNHYNTYLARIVFRPAKGHKPSVTFDYA